MGSDQAFSAGDDWPWSPDAIVKAATLEHDGADLPWTPWTGGDRPHKPATPVEVELRCGRFTRCRAAYVRWWHASGGMGDPDQDVVRYRERALPPGDVPLPVAVNLVHSLAGLSRPELAWLASRAGVDAATGADNKPSADGLTAEGVLALRAKLGRAMEMSV